MKILLATLDDIGGVGRVCIDLMKTFREMGHDCHVVVCNKYTQTDGVERYGHWRWRLARTLSVLVARYCQKRPLRRLGRQVGKLVPVLVTSLQHSRWVKWADVIHLHLMDDDFDYPSFFRSIGDKPVVFTLHDENFFYGLAHYEYQLQNKHPQEQYYAEKKRRGLAQVKHLGIVMLSDYFGEKFKGHELLEGREVRIINNAVNTTLYRPVPKADARQKLGLSEEDTLIAFVATYMSEERKGLDLLSETVSRIGNPRIKIIAVGKNIHHRSWPNVIEMGYKDTADALCEVLSAADFFAMPSMQEAFALTPMQAMACGRPVVAFPVSGTSELINDRNGVICSDFTVEALQTGILTLMRRSYDPAAIRQDMITRFSPELIASKYCDLYQTVGDGSFLFDAGVKQKRTVPNCLTRCNNSIK